MRYSHYALVTSIVALWFVSLTLLVTGTVLGEFMAIAWALWMLGPAVVVSCWMLLWDHRTKATERIESLLGSEEAGVERLASAVALAMVRDRTTPIR